MTVDISARISDIISERKKNLPAVRNQYERIDVQVQRISVAIKAGRDLQTYSTKIDEELLEQLGDILAKLEDQCADYSEARQKVQDLESRFSRETVNIGVSGEARVGKSTTLQSFSGLSDTQIPTGKGLPVTAVRSEIFNAAEEYAEIELRDAESFLSEYVAPHLQNINDAAGLALQAKSLSEFRAMAIPATLGNNVDSKSSNSLRCLREAQESFGFFSPLLTGGTIRVKLDEIRKYVAYPTDEEKQSGAPVERAYLAVRGVKVFCQFPSLGDERIGLIDLPGLGEVGESVAKIHTSGLENGVDQVLLIMMPTDKKGFADAGIQQNVDQLRRIQEGISRRGDLIVAAINIDETNQESARSLRNDFESAINAPQESDKIEVRDFIAIDSESVQALFGYLLEKLVSALPAMDKDVFDYVMNANIGVLNSKCDLLLSQLNALANKILKTIPLEDALLDSMADTLSRALVSEYENLEEERYALVGKSNPQRATLENQIKAIHDANSRAIVNGLFLSSNKAWQTHAKGRSDYVSFLRSEARRVKAEIIDSYRGVDVCYDSAIQDLKARVLDIFLSATGNLSELLGINPDSDFSDEDILSMADELDSLIRDEEFTHCFRFLSEISFKFSQNVFYNIYSSMEELHNPDVNTEIARRGLSGEQRISAVETELKRMASEGNSLIRDEILRHNDVFNQFLFTCMTFFNDFLYRKDDKRFERDIRILLKECRDYIIPDEDIRVDRDVQTAVKALKAAIDGNLEAAASTPYQPSQASTRKAAKKKSGSLSSVAEAEKPEMEPMLPVSKEPATPAAKTSPERNAPEEKSFTPPYPHLKTNGANEPKKSSGSKKSSGYQGNFSQEW